MPNVSAADRSPRSSIAHRSVEELGGPRSVLVRQRRDHERLDELLAEVRATTGEAQDAALARTCRLVFPHAFAEEAVLWPAIRRAVPDAEAKTTEVEREHQEINETWAAIERSRHGDPGREALLERAIELLVQDVRDEEDDLLPRLALALAPGDLRRLGDAWELVRRTAPTRAHPVVARRPPGNVIAALPLSALDRTRDGLDALTRRVPAPLGHGTHVAERGLALLTGALEQLPPLRRGEDPSTHSGRTAQER